MEHAEQGFDEELHELAVVLAQPLEALVDAQSVLRIPVHVLQQRLYHTTHE